MSDKSQQDFAAFYTTRPFCPENGTYRAENEHFILKVNADGLILLCLKSDYLRELYLVNKCKNTEKMEYKWSYYTTFLNALYLLLDCYTLKDLQLAYFDISEVTTKDIMVVTLDENESIQGISYQYGDQIARYASTNNSLKISENILNRVSITLEQCCLDCDRLHMLADLGKGLSEYKILSFSTSLILLWFVIERFVTSIWNRYLEEQNKTFDRDIKRINSDRKSQLTRYLDIHKTLNFLELTETLDFSKFEVLNELRDVRNKIAHRNNKFICKKEHCLKAFDMIKYFIETEYEIDLIFNTRYLLMGIYDRSSNNPRKADSER